MRWSVRCSLLLSLLAVPAALHSAAVPKALDNSQVRKELSGYFAQIAQNSPTVLGTMAKSPDTMAAVQKRIAGMSDEELSGFRKLMAETPDWKMAPEVFTRAFPPDVLKQIKRVGNEYVATASRGDEMRNDVKTLASILKLLPDAKLKEVGVDRTMLDSLEATFEGISPLQATMLHQKAGEVSAWDARSAAALDAIPPALRRGAAALAQHGPLTEKDVAELSSFRSSLNALLARIDNLPPETRKTLKVDEFRGQMKQLGTAPPDMLYMVRHNVPTEMLEALASNVSFLERIAGLTPKEKKELETFRSELTAAFETLEPESSESSKTPGFEAMLSDLGPAQLTLLKDSLSTYGNWQTALPVLYRTLASPELPSRLALLKGATLDPQAVAGLEDFRKQTFAEIASTATISGIDPTLVDSARARLAATPLDRLEVMRMSLESLGKSATPGERLSIVAMHTINFNCAVSMPDPVPNINLDFICDPIERALESIEHAVLDTVNSLVATVKSTLDTTISTISSALTSAVSAITSTVNSLVSSITSTVSTISAFVQTIPDLAWQAIQTALNLLLDIQIRNGVTLRNLVAQGAETGLNSMKTLLGLTPGWWSAISTFNLPQIPCPGTGVHTPFGTVGSGAAAANYARYRLMIDNLVGMIPDTELSLKFKIPAQILYLAYDFLGVCLEQAASDADSAESATRNTLVLANFTSLQTYIGTQVAGLALASGGQTTQLITLINAEGATLRNAVIAQSNSTQSLLNGSSSSNTAMVNAQTAATRSLIQRESDDTQADVKAFRKLNLRLAIERVLQSGEGREVAYFQLLEPLGVLRLVSDVVRETIDAMATAGQSSGQARKFYDEGSSLMNAGKEKDAFKRFAMAYRAATQ